MSCFVRAYLHIEACKMTPNLIGRFKLEDSLAIGCNRLFGCAEAIGPDGPTGIQGNKEKITLRSFFPCGVFHFLNGAFERGMEALPTVWKSLASVTELKSS